MWLLQSAWTTFDKQSALKVRQARVEREKSLQEEARQKLQALDVSCLAFLCGLLVSAMPAGSCCEFKAETGRGRHREGQRQRGRGSDKDAPAHTHTYTHTHTHTRAQVNTMDGDVFSRFLERQRELSRRSDEVRLEGEEQKRNSDVHRASHEIRNFDVSVFTTPTAPCNMHAHELWLCSPSFAFCLWCSLKAPMSRHGV